MAHFFRQPLDDVLACLERLAASPRPYLALLATGMSLIVTWFVYVPIHELLHAWGCVVTGGEVSRLEIAPQYGAALLAKWFPFVTSGSDYAGRLSGFDTGGSDWVYLATDFAPFLLSVVIGVPMLRACGQRRRPLLLGSAIVVGLAPFYNLIGDYYEMASILTTRAVTTIRGGGEVAFAGIRADDIFKLIGEVCSKPSELGLEGAGQIAVGSVLIAVSLALAILLAFVTHAMGGVVARVVLGRTRMATAQED